MYGERLKELRKERGLTQTQFAKLINTTQKNISKYELEQLDLNTETIILICKTLNISADYLLGLEDETGAKTYVSNSFNNFSNSGNFKL